MKTKILNSNQTDIAADILKSGGLVAIPTETVYGLAASAYKPQSIKNIFIAKGRPMDNPLIVHIADIKNIYEVVSEFHETAQKLAEKFWPGPLTMILPKNSKIPNEVCAGLSSVAVRFPSNKIAQEIILKTGEPLVAPSANLSGKPSPTKFEHVFEDLNSKIDAIVDGGDCTVGLESTVVSLLEEIPRILRPGAISADDIKNTVGCVKIDDAVFKKSKAGEKVLSPGMKYKHYSPKTPVTMIISSAEKYSEFINSKKNDNIIALCFNEDIQNINVPYVSYGGSDDVKTQAQKLFGALRDADKLQGTHIYAHYKDVNGFSVAVYNRLVRAAGFDIINL